MRKIETTQSSFLLKYGASLFILTELLMICTIIVLYGTGGAYIPTFVMLFLAPFLGGIIAGKVAKKQKNVTFKENINKCFIITNIVIYIVIYFFNFRLNIVLAMIYLIGALGGYFCAKKTIKILKNNIEGEKTEKFSDGDNILIKKFKLEKFNSENIKEFLKMNKLEEENYILAQIIPTAKEYLLYGYFSLSGYIQYILHFDDKKLYFFELSKLTNKTIKNGFCINFEDLKIKKLKKGLLTYRIYVEFKNGSKANIQIPKEVFNMYMQKQYSEKLYQKLLELKNK